MRELADVAYEVTCLSAYIAAGRLCSYVVVPTLLSACSGGSAVSGDRASSSDNLWSIVFHSYVTWLAVVGSWELGFTPASRWGRQSEMGTLAGLLICADNLCQLPVQFAKKVPLSKSWTVLAHHIAQTCVFLLALHTGRCHFWGVFATVSEATNPPISMVFTLKECNLDELVGSRSKSSTLYTLSSVMCWLSFVVFRMILYPLWLLGFAHDLANHPEESLERTSGVELALYPAVMVLMLYLSAVWFVPLSQGTAKVWKEWQAAAQQIKQTKSQKAS